MARSVFSGLLGSPKCLAVTSGRLASVPMNTQTHHFRPCSRTQFDALLAIKPSSRQHEVGPGDSIYPPSLFQIELVSSPFLLRVPQSPSDKPFKQIVPLGWVAIKSGRVTPNILVQAQLPLRDDMRAVRPRGLDHVHTRFKIRSCWLSQLIMNEPEANWPSFLE